MQFIYAQYAKDSLKMVTLVINPRGFGVFIVSSLVLMFACYRRDTGIQHWLTSSNRSLEKRGKLIDPLPTCYMLTCVHLIKSLPENRVENWIFLPYPDHMTSLYKTIPSTRSVPNYKLFRIPIISCFSFFRYILKICTMIYTITRHRQ